MGKGLVGRMGERVRKTKAGEIGSENKKVS
jgi:hypothetical protein